MFYIGAALISVLSFFTTLSGLAIVLPNWLALVGSLGLQTAMLGIAWNMIGLKENRAAYATVFTVAAVFSVFFSYANFDANLRDNTRALSARTEYAEAARATLAEYTHPSKEALGRAEYQSQRHEDLLSIEREQGWATMVDEGSRDPFIQATLEGARRTVNSWSESQGRDYRQGNGEGLIVNYLKTRFDMAQSNHRTLDQYVALLDSISAKLTSQKTVYQQFALVNHAAARYPSAVIAATMLNTQSSPIAPPEPGKFVEKASSAQHTLALILDDLFVFDRVTQFSLALALAIDLITLLIALAGGSALHSMSRREEILERVEEETFRRFKNASAEQPEKFNERLQENLERYRLAHSYIDQLDQLSGEESGPVKVTLARPPESPQNS